MTALRDFTSARVGLGLAGDSLPVKPLLDFRLAHARARDAVHFPLDSLSLLQEIAARQWSARVLHTQARDRQEYLRRPDQGRLLDQPSIVEVNAVQGPTPITFVTADGLSALAVHRHALPLLDLTLRELAIAPDEQNPLWIAHQARVALGDHIGGLLSARLSVVLIGERPGLSTPDSLGVYLTWQPRPGRVDAERNCISNIHAQGLSYESAAHKLLFLIRESLRRQLSGVNLKEAATQAAMNSASGFAIL
jgi:ethanolamine ammonia-lyase small subunit